MGLFDFFGKKPAPKPAGPPRPLLRPMGAGLPPHPEPKAENNFNIKVWWQRVELKTGNATAGYATNQFTFQMQAYYF